MIRRSLSILSALALLHEFGAPPLLSPAPFLREPEPLPLTAQDVERIEAAKAKRARKAARRGGTR